jgi:glutathione S-transferase
VLGDNQYLMGNQVSGADATAFAFIAAALPAIFESPMQKKLAGTKNLVAYSERMMAEFFPGFVKQ